MQLRYSPGKNTIEVRESIAVEADETDKESLMLNEKTYDYIDEELKELNELQEKKNKEKISSLVEQINRDLNKKINKKKQKREKLRFKYPPWLYITIFIILLLIVLSYLVINRMLQHP